MVSDEAFEEWLDSCYIAGSIHRDTMIEVILKWKAMKLQVGVFRDAYRARYAVQLHENDCRSCDGAIVCLRGQELRHAANVAEEKAGEADTDA